MSDSKRRSKRRAYRCPQCGTWVFDERKRKQCGNCGKRFTEREAKDGMD